MQPIQKIYLQDGDREVYESIMSGAKDMGSRRGKLKAAWGILRKAVRESDPHALMKGLSRFKVIKFACQQDNDPQQIFESLNTRGVKLNEHEKVKNWLLMSLPHETQKNVYHNHWLRIESCLGGLKKGKPIDTFLFDFVRWKTGMTKGMSYTYPNLRRWWYKCSDQQTQENLCKELSRVASLYGQITGTGQYHSNLKVRAILQHLQFLGLDVHRPFTLRLLDDATRPEETRAHRGELIQVLETVSIWFTRLWVSDNGLAGLNTEMIRLAHDTGPETHGPYGNYWIEQIRKLGHRGIGVPNEDEIRYGIPRRAAYGGKASGAGKTILWTINANIADSRPDRVEDLVLEHVMPIRAVEGRPDYSGEDDRMEMVKKHSNSLANLTLVENEIHSETRHLPYMEKRAIYSESRVPLTRQLAATYPDWTEEEMMHRADWIADRILEIWPWEERFYSRSHF